MPLKEKQADLKNLILKISVTDSAGFLSFSKWAQLCKCNCFMPKLKTHAIKFSHNGFVLIGSRTFFNKVSIQYYDQSLL